MCKKKHEPIDFSGLINDWGGVDDIMNQLVEVISTLATRDIEQVNDNSFFLINIYNVFKNHKTETQKSP